MIWLWLYLGLGLIFGLGVYAQNARRPKSGIGLLLESMRGAQSWMDQILEKVVVPALGSILVVAAWPAVLAWYLNEKKKEKVEVTRRVEAVFRVRPEDLTGQTTIAEVETSNFIKDPLGAVPELPFGHLNAVWTDFVASRPADAQLWTFACNWTSEWRTQYSRNGYVWVVGGTLSPWMLTQDNALADEDE
jgi:hypothetical protein